jgi:transcriptional regulator with XRE-family HTH domain
MKNDKPIWAVNLRKARKQLGLTQQEVADKIFKSQQAYDKYEKGETEPDLATWILLCDIFDVTDLIRFINRDYYTKEAA